jgi:hypothetical protein
MRLSAQGFQDTAIKKAFSDALLGKEDLLFAFLVKNSGLPGTRINQAVAEAFAFECAREGKASEKLALGMLDLPADYAQGGTAFEFLPVCGAFAVAARAAKDKTYISTALPVLKDASDDMRFRVRDAVALGLSWMGAASPEETLAGTDSWTEGFTYAASLTEALSQATFVDAIKKPEIVVARIDGCFRLALNAPRAAERYPGYKSLIEALPVATAMVAARFGPPMFDAMELWCKAKEPMLREVILASIRGNRVRNRYAEDVVRIEAALHSTKAIPRDPTRLIQGMRGRGKKRR